MSAGGFLSFALRHPTPRPLDVPRRGCRPPGSQTVPMVPAIGLASNELGSQDSASGMLSGHAKQKGLVSVASAYNRQSENSSIT